jgi:hypothetical protein
VVHQLRRTERLVAGIYLRRVLEDLGQGRSLRSLARALSGAFSTLASPACQHASAF